MDLSRASTADLCALRDRLASGQLGTPLTRAGLHSFPSLLDHASRLVGQALNVEALLAVLDAVLAERSRKHPELELVWTGPDAHGSETRDTAALLRELFASARREVILAGYSFDGGTDLFVPLRKVMIEHGVEARFFIDVPRPKNVKGPIDPTACAREVVDNFVQKEWPGAAAPFPRFFFDPRTVGDTPFLSLHAKCVVIDRERALVGSANFTRRGTERNIECGALIRDPVYAERFARQWTSLVSAGVVQTLPGLG